MRNCLLIFGIFATLAHGSEYDDLDQKKRGFDKGSNTNTIPTGAQKQEYSYSIYSQNPSSQSSQSASSSYQQVPNSFYPNQGSSHYYSSSGTEAPSTYSAPQSYSTPQVGHVASQPAQFSHINFVPNPGYQAKYQIIPSKQGLQVAILQPQYSFQSQPAFQYTNTLFAHNPSNMNQLGISPFQHLLSNSYIGHPSSMFLFQPQPHQLYSNLLYNPHQASTHSPINNQAKYSVQFSPTVPPSYDTIQPQSIHKDENEVGSSNNYSNSDSDSSYKNTYSSRNNYVKLS